MSTQQIDNNKQRLSFPQSYRNVDPEDVGDLEAEPFCSCPHIEGGMKSQLLLKGVNIWKKKKYEGNMSHFEKQPSSRGIPAVAVIVWMKQACEKHVTLCPLSQPVQSLHETAVNVGLTVSEKLKNCQKPPMFPCRGFCSHAVKQSGKHQILSLEDHLTRVYFGMTIIFTELWPNLVFVIFTMDTRYWWSSLGNWIKLSE